MNINLNAKRILCFGDSNTWGQDAFAHDVTMRYPVNIRWTGVLQKSLGDGFDVIEEGLNGRTTDLTYQYRPGRNGKEYLVACLQSQSPLDAVVLMTGTNDLKQQFGPRTPKQIGVAIEGLVADIIRLATNSLGSSPDIILVSPLPMNPSAPEFAELFHKHFDARSVAASHELAPVIKDIADKHHCYFIDAADIAKAGDDGIHMDEDSHKRFGLALAEKIKEWV